MKTTEPTTYHRQMNGQIERARDGAGQPLPQGFSREVLRAWRSKYPPHVGEKQKRKALARMSEYERTIARADRS